MLKTGIRTIGIDDGPFGRDKHRDVLVVGAIYRGSSDFDGLLTTKVKKDGWNSTECIVSMINASKFAAQLHYIILDGIAFGGFNIVDIQKLNLETGIKVLVTVRKRPNFNAVRKALNHISFPEKRWSLIEKAGEINKIHGLYCQLAGMDPDEAKELLNLTCTRSKLPESLRAAHLIAGGLVTGQSGRRA